MYCKKCGAMIPDDAMFCPACGATQSSTEASAKTSGGTPAQPMGALAQTSEGNQTEKKKTNMMIIIGFICSVPNLLIMMSGGSSGAIPFILAIVGAVLCIIGGIRKKKESQ